MPNGALERLWTSLPAIVALLGLVAGPMAGPRPGVPSFQRQHPLKQGQGQGHRSAKHVRAVSSGQARLGPGARTVMISGRGPRFDLAGAGPSRAGLLPGPIRRTAPLSPITPTLARSQPIRC